jgi:high affinity Mn2+ porin
VGGWWRQKRERGSGSFRMTEWKKSTRVTEPESHPFRTVREMIEAPERPSHRLTGREAGRLRTMMSAGLWLVALWAWAPIARGQDAPAQPDRVITEQSSAANQTTPSGERSDPSPGAADDPPPPAMFPHFRDTRLWVSGQANFIFQTHPGFHAPYSGQNSLDPNYEKATSRVLTLYTGVRVSRSTELLVDIEEAGGAALSTGLGLAGFTNLDIVRNPLLSKAPYLARGMIHKVIGLSKDMVENQRNALSLFDEVPRRRLELRFGKFSMVDFFDLNSVGSDTHSQFTNWTIDNNGAYDYAADTRGYTVGFAADYEDRNWGFRFAEALMPKVANGIALVWKPWQAHAENFEYQLRREFLPKKPGVVRVLAYTNAANMGIYRDAVTQFEKGLVPAPDITHHRWHITRKYGFGINLEQNLVRNVTAFARFGWSNGRTESFAYTEVDQTFEAGLGASGAMWRRRFDRAGVAFVTNAICKDHQLYLADGGYGFLIGDGTLRYGRENMAPGLQHIVDPGYNRDRGPVLVPSFRLHLEF